MSRKASLPCVSGSGVHRISDGAPSELELQYFALGRWKVNPELLGDKQTLQWQTAQ